jgi:possible histidinol-phosphate transaminase
LKGIFSKYVADIIKVYPSYTNFVLTKGVLAQQLGAFIHENGFKPRFYDEGSYERLCPLFDCYRRTASYFRGSCKEMERTL